MDLDSVFNKLNIIGGRTSDEKLIFKKSVENSGKPLEEYMKDIFYSSLSSSMTEIKGEIKTAMMYYNQLEKVKYLERENRISELIDTLAVYNI